jgi:hypothetical protein
MALLLQLGHQILFIRVPGMIAAYGYFHLF